MSDLLGFDGEFHEDIFKLFILASNDWDVCIRGLSIDHCLSYYRFQFKDRSFAPIEHIGFVNDDGFSNYDITAVDRKEGCVANLKIIYRFEE